MLYVEHAISDFCLCSQVQILNSTYKKQIMYLSDKQTASKCAPYVQ
jgi:hypothetical protein